MNPCTLLVGMSNGAAVTENITIMEVPQKTKNRTTVRGLPGGSDGKKINPPTMQETLVQCLGQEDPLEKG